MRDPASGSTRSSLAKSREAHVDPSAFIAFMDASDRHQPLFARLLAASPTGRRAGRTEEADAAVCGDR